MTTRDTRRNFHRLLDQTWPGVQSEFVAAMRQARAGVDMKALEAAIGRGCSSLTSFPANAFNNVKGGNFTDAFTSTALTQTSIDNILVSLVTSGIAAGTRVFDQSGGSAPSATGEAAIDTLRSRGWTVTVTGGY